MGRIAGVYALLAKTTRCVFIEPLGVLTVHRPEVSFSDETDCAGVCV